MTRLKVWFNRRYPGDAFCLHRWCWRATTVDYRCHLHQGDA